MKIALDTNAYSDWRRAGLWNAIVSQASCVAIPVFVLGELRSGFLRGGLGAKNEGGLLAFLSNPIVRVLHTSERTSTIYAEFKNFLRKQGTPIPENDVWIATLVHEHGFLLCTSDTHFEALPQVALATPSEPSAASSSKHKKRLGH